MCYDKWDKQFCFIIFANSDATSALRGQFECATPHKTMSQSSQGSKVNSILGVCSNRFWSQGPQVKLFGKLRVVKWTYLFLRLLVTLFLLDFSISCSNRP